MAKEKAIIDVSEYGYKTYRVRDRRGALRHVRGNGDALFRAITLHTIVQGKSLDTVARANKLKLSASYPNQGQRTMTINGQLRRLVLAGTPVVVGDYIIKSLDQKQPAFPSEASLGLAA